jgi:hypothetical protein
MIGNILNVREKLKELSSEEQKRLLEEYGAFLIECTRLCRP